MAERTRQVNIRLTEREYATLAADAQARSMSVSSYVRLMACDKLGVSSILLYQDLLKASDELDGTRAALGAMPAGPQRDAALAHAKSAQGTVDSCILVLQGDY